MLTARKTGATDADNPAAAAWETAPAERVSLAPTPLGLQPNAYIQARWEGKPYGQISQVELRALTDGSSIYLRLAWADATEDREPRGTETFADGAAVVFPVNGDAPLITMGSADAPVNAWQWRADLPNESARNVMATGIGTSYATPASAVRCRGVWKEGRWAVVFSRALALPDAAGGGAQFRPGAEIKYGVALWDGANGERAGIKAYSRSWQTLKVAS